MKILKEIGKAFFVGILIFIVVSAIEYANGYNVITSGRFLERFFFNQLYTVSLYMSNFPLFVYLLKRFEDSLFRWKILLPAILAGVLITIFVIFLLRFFTEVIYFETPYLAFLKNERASYYSVSLLISMVVSIIFYSVFYYRFKQESKVKEQKIIAGTASAQFDALKNQLDPHFLFNSLNVLTSLIEENPQAATKFTTSLSKVYRYVLEQKNKELVTVEEELKFAKLYMTLLQMRFEESISFTVSKNITSFDGKVVPLSLQLLLENAVKHNQVTASKKLEITIEEVNGFLQIKNAIQPKSVVKESSGVGLQNIIQRYQLLTKQKVTIENDNRNFVVHIPILSKDTKQLVVSSKDFITEKKYSTAIEKVEKLKAFYGHLIVYMLFIPVFIALNYISGTSFPWALFPIGGWGLGVIGHATETFNWNPFFGKDWEERKIRELMDKEK